MIDVAVTAEEAAARCGDQHDPIVIEEGVTRCSQCGELDFFTEEEDNMDALWNKPTTVDEAVMRGYDPRGVAQVTHYDPAAEAMATAGELARLRDVEQLARELAARLNFVTIEWDGDDALKALIARARKLGLLE